MYDEKNVYNYVVSSMTNILNNGIEYYSDKNSEIYVRLLEIKRFINQEVKFKSIDEEKPKKVEKKVVKTNIVDERNVVDKDLLDGFMKKIMDIKISVLNLETDLPLYYNYRDSSLEEDNIKKELLSTEDIEVKEEPVINEIHNDTFKKNNKPLLDLFKKN